ncbi:MAG: hypothetical protein NW217_07370 [Hyphomicrobiaceae bacterium]|nr:hypothetical protein [Hyphomicrobiaceae bacterium]
MRAQTVKYWLWLATLGTALGQFADPAEARIKCDRGLQSVGGSLLSTPFCQDAYIAEVARSYGTRVTASEVRNNPNVRRSICEHIGQDIRIRHACESSVPTFSGRGL